MAMSEVAGYCRALRDALCDEDPDLWNRDTAQSQIEDARNFLERLRENPPPPGDRIATIAWNDAVKRLQDEIDLVQDKLNGDTTFGVFVSNNPYMIEKIESLVSFGDVDVEVESSDIELLE